MKRLLLVINTLGHAGAEIAMLEFLKKVDRTAYQVSLYVVMGQGELISKVPSDVQVLNHRLSCLSVWSRRGVMRMAATVLAAFFRNGGYLRKLSGLAKNFVAMFGKGRLQVDKLLWHLVADGAHRFEENFDLAVAWMEGGSAYYVAEHVKAKSKAAFVHIVYGEAGYTPQMDRGCWEKFQYIFTVSEEVKEAFAKAYPHYKEKILIFPNIINRREIIHRAQEAGGFADDYDGFRLLTVGRLVYQKGYNIAVRAMRILKERGYRGRWYVLGDGEERKRLEKEIADLGLEEDFLLLGAVENPYPYYRQADLYVHVTRYEGKSIAIQEAQVLGCAVIASDCPGNREQIVNGQDGILCKLEPEAIADSIIGLLEDRKKREMFQRAAGAKEMPQGKEFELLAEFMESTG